MWREYVKYQYMISSEYCLLSRSEYFPRRSPDKILSRCSHSWDQTSRNWQFISSEYCLPLKIQFPGVKKISQREIRLVIFYKYYKIKVFVMLSDSFLDDLQPSTVQKYEVPTTFIFKFLLFALEENHKYLLHHKSTILCTSKYHQQIYGIRLHFYVQNIFCQLCQFWTTAKHRY